MATLGERLKSLRKNKKMSQELLGQRINVDRGSIAAYEQNRHQPPDSIKKVLADFFGVSIDFLCGFSDTKTNENYILFNNDNYIQIPIVDKLLEDTKIIKGYTLVPKEKFLDASCFFINSTDDYSLARVKKGDTLYVKEQCFIEKEALMLVSINNKSYIKKIFEDGPNYMLFNPSSSPEIIRLIKNQVKIIGIVIEVSFKL